MPDQGCLQSCRAVFRSSSHQANNSKCYLSQRCRGCSTAAPARTLQDSASFKVISSSQLVVFLYAKRYDRAVISKGAQFPGAKNYHDQNFSIGKQNLFFFFFF